MVPMQDIIDDLNALQAIVHHLEERFPGRKFTLDGHLVGSIGEVWAEHLFGLEPLKASTERHDARAPKPDGRLVQVKATTGNKTVAISSEPQHLIVLRLLPEGGTPEVVYNGPGADAWALVRDTVPSGGRNQRPLSLTKLRRLQATIPQEQRLPLVSR